MQTKEIAVIGIIIGIIVAIVVLLAFGSNNSVNSICKIVLLVFVILIILYILYELYEHFNAVRRKEPLLIKGSVDATSPNAFSADLVPQSNVGVEYTYSFWVYVNGWDYNYDMAKHVLTRGDPAEDSFNPSIYFYPKTSSLMIRFATRGGADNYTYHPGIDLDMAQGATDVPNSAPMHVDKVTCGSMCSKMSNCKGYSIDSTGKDNHCHIIQSNYSVNDLVNSATANTNEYNNKPCNTGDDCGPSSHKDAYVCMGGGGTKDLGKCRNKFDSYVKSNSMDPNKGDLGGLDTNSICDIVELPLQRWVHVGVVLWNRTTDIYLNGKLARSCILPNVPYVNWGAGVQVCNNGGFNGKMASLRYFNRSLNATEMYKLYSKGPMSWGILSEFANLFPQIYSDVKSI